MKVVSASAILLTAAVLAPGATLVRCAYRRDHSPEGEAAAALAAKERERSIASTNTMLRLLRAPAKPRETTGENELAGLVKSLAWLGSLFARDVDAGHRTGG